MQENVWHEGPKTRWNAIAFGNVLKFAFELKKWSMRDDAVLNQKLGKNNAMFKGAR